MKSVLSKEPIFYEKKINFKEHMLCLSMTIAFWIKAPRFISGIPYYGIIIESRDTLWHNKILCIKDAVAYVLFIVCAKDVQWQDQLVPLELREV